MISHALVSGHTLDVSCLNFSVIFGLDITYSREDGREAIGACSVFCDGALKKVYLQKITPPFEYVCGFLGLREAIPFCDLVR